MIQSTFTRVPLRDGPQHVAIVAATRDEVEAIIESGDPITLTDGNFTGERIRLGRQTLTWSVEHDAQMARTIGILGTCEWHGAQACIVAVDKDTFTEADAPQLFAARQRERAAASREMVERERRIDALPDFLDDPDEVR